MNLPGKRYEEIIEKVISTFMKHEIESIPIDCFEIAEKMNIKLVRYSELDEAGLAAAKAQSEDGFCLLLEDGEKPLIYEQWYILYDDTMPVKRIRFTIMHEIGHIVLEHLETSDLAEAEANFFAKYSLAPPPLVNQVSPEDYLELGREFNLSNQCAYFAFRYYKKWKRNTKCFYNIHELQLLEQFKLDYLAN